MNHLRFITALLLFQFLFTGFLFADINSWVDEDGVRHYSDSPPERPEGTYEIIEETESKTPPTEIQKSDDYLEQLINQRNIREEEDKEKKRLKREEAEKDQKISDAYEGLTRLKNLVAGDVDWDEYERMLADAKQKLDALAGIPETDEVKKRLTEAYDSYAVVPELKRLEMTGQRKGLITTIQKMNAQLETNAPDNYYRARRVFWEHAAEKLDKSGINP